VVLDVHQVEVRVPRANVEVRKDRPKAWSVVHEPHLVCPGCHKRHHVRGEPKEVKCPECGNSYGVDWGDRA
jgi:ribosomal protein L37AE/L43A